MEVSSINGNGNRSQHKLLVKFRRRSQRFAARLRQQAASLARCQKELQQVKQQLEAQEHEIASVKARNQSQEDGPANPQAPCFSDSTVFNHRFPATMVALCVNLSRIMALRTIPKSLEIVLAALGIQADVPDRETITRWCKRIGLNRLMTNQESSRLKSHKDMIWIVDHSNQIGTQKVLVVLGIPASKLPARGKTLKLNALEVLAIEPGDSWTRDDMRSAYKNLAEKIGRPRWVLCDGAVELRESVDVLCDEDHKTHVLRDFKHVAANRFESLIGKSERFRQFIAEMGKTRCLVQQSELAHLTPPSLKTKSRFMNIEPIIAWATMVLGVLAEPQTPPSGVTDVQKLNQRFGWLRDFAESIASWKRCCDVIEWSLAWINTHPLEPHTAHEMRMKSGGMQSQKCNLSAKMIEELLESVEQACSNVRPGELAWLSSECLESAFALFKQREGQQSRSGFTGLLLTFPILLRSWTASEVREAMMQTTTNAIKIWSDEMIGTTVWAKRTKAYNHFCPNVRQDLKAA